MKEDNHDSTAVGRRRSWPTAMRLSTLVRSIIVVVAVLAAVIGFVGLVAVSAASADTGGSVGAGNPGGYLHQGGYRNLPASTDYAM